MSRVERDPFEGLLGKLMALPVVGIVYLVIRFWHFIPRMISFTGAWLLIAVLLGGPAYDYFINNYYMRIDGDFITFLMPTFVLSGIAVRNTIRVFRQPGTFIKKLKHL